MCWCWCLDSSHQSLWVQTELTGATGELYTCAEHLCFFSFSSCSSFTQQTRQNMLFISETDLPWCCSAEREIIIKNLLSIFDETKPNTSDDDGHSCPISCTIKTDFRLCLLLWSSSRSTDKTAASRDTQFTGIAAQWSSCDFQINVCYCAVCW